MFANASFCYTSKQQSGGGCSGDTVMQMQVSLLFSPHTYEGTVKPVTKDHPTGPQKVIL